ncbi:Carboxypeptidase regulatory-like domain-containing protein [Palleronia marisminoris]|uniref:CehA/McbA family metallohydrolase n=1 Tax=Palleronia marisminoris TaxID=315423 RepID=UPI0008EFEE60|nr:CehA/McbA family metallohydrolase [Palleronia marisminoris]SFH27466.1 Carboxypeptidase regulatory-like domain-containing protein [Palleronia marisminoris]
MTIRSRLLLTAAIGMAQPALAEVTLTRGSSPVPDGEALSTGDLTVQNEHLAFTIAVDSQAPWGVPRGAIVDLAPVTDGEIALDRIAFADFIPNNWSAWPNTGREVEIVTETPEKVVIRITRDFGEADIATTYTLEEGSDRIHLVTEMTNRGDVPLVDQMSGFTLWPDSGYILPVPGLAGVDSGSAEDALSDRVVAYDEDWFIALHAPYFDRVEYASKDLYATHTLAPGETRSFEGWLQVGPSGDLAPVVAAEIARGDIAAGSLAGQIASTSGPVEDSVLVVEKEGVPYIWTLTPDGSYEIDLPAGDYSVYATAAGYSDSAPQQVTVAADGSETLGFEDLKAPGLLDFAVTDSAGEPLDARITITEGQAPLVEFLGRQTFFTELDQVGGVQASIAPGDYVFTVGHGTGFLTEGEEVSVSVASDETQEVDVALELIARPYENDWYASDMHHHADQLEGTTPPEYVARSELAAGLDVIFLSDHDSTANHGALAEIAEMRGVPFIPSAEFSPSWGHFNAYPLSLGEPLEIDTSTATAAEVMAEARRLGADAIQVNHPFIPYGYLASLEAGTVPGGFAPDFDLLEMNGPDDDDAVFARAAQFWTQGQRIFLSAGSDAHDVWNDNTGSARAYVHVPGGVSADGFVANLKAGRAYVTRGPLIEPEIMFGTELRIAPDEERSLSFDLTAVNGLATASLIGPDGEISSQSFDKAPSTATAEFSITATPRTEGEDWVALRVEDTAGKTAYSDPIWINPLGEPDVLSQD